MKKNKINVHNGTAKIIESNKDQKVVKVIDKEKRIEDHIKFLIIATGLLLKIYLLYLQMEKILDYRTAMTSRNFLNH